MKLVTALFFFVSGSVIASNQVQLRYDAVDKSKPRTYQFQSEISGLYRSPKDTRTMSQTISGTFRESLSGMSFRKLPLILREFEADHYQLNGQETTVGKHYRNLMSYRYELHPQKGMLSKLEFAAFDPRDVMELNVVFPKKPVGEGDSFSPDWVTYASPRQGERPREPYPLKGAIKVTKISETGIVTLQGLFGAQIPVPEGLSMQGKVSVRVDYRFDSTRGVFLEGKTIQQIVWESRTKLARALAKISKGKQRLGYKLRIKYRFKLVES